MVSRDSLPFPPGIITCFKSVFCDHLFSDFSATLSYFFTFYTKFLGALRAVDECCYMNEPFYAAYKQEGEVENEKAEDSQISGYAS